MRQMLFALMVGCGLAPEPVPVNAVNATEQERLYPPSAEDLALDWQTDLSADDCALLADEGCRMIRRLPWPGRPEYQCWCPAE